MILLKKLDVDLLRPLMPLFTKMLIAAVGAGIVTLIVGHSIVHEPTLRLWLGRFDVEYTRTIVGQVGQFFVQGMIFGVSFLGGCHFMRIDLLQKIRS